MDIFSLRCFVMLAKHLNFTKTANIMNVSQPSLTRIIQNLEDELGILLIDRSKYRIELTQAGNEFLHHIVSTISNYDNAVQYAKAVENSQNGLVRIGYLSYMCAPLIPAIYNNIRKQFPNISLELIPYRMDEMISAINGKRIDIGLLPDWRFSSYLEDCKKEPFFKDQYYIVMHKDHPLSNRETLSLNDVEQETYLFYRSNGDYNYDTERESIFTMNKDLSLSLLPNTQHVSDFVGMFSLLDCNLGFSILPSHTKDYCPPSLRYIEISPPLDEFIGIMCWYGNNKNIYLKDIRKIIVYTCDEYDTRIHRNYAMDK